jgi:hypothetical protein
LKILVLGLLLGGDAWTSREVSNYFSIDIYHASKTLSRYYYQRLSKRKKISGSKKYEYTILPKGIQRLEWLCSEDDTMDDTIFDDEADANTSSM